MLTVHFSPSEIIVPEFVAIENKVKVLLSRVTSLETLFVTPPAGADEQMRRNGGYDTKSPLHSVLTVSHKARWH